MKKKKPANVNILILRALFAKFVIRELLLMQKVSMNSKNLFLSLKLQQSKDIKNQDNLMIGWKDQVVLKLMRKLLMRGSQLEIIAIMPLLPIIQIHIY